MAAWVWWGGEPAASLRSWRLQERAVDTVRRSGRRTCPKVFTGGWNRSNHWRGVFPSAKITPLGPQVGGLQSREAG